MKDLEMEMRNMFQTIFSDQLNPVPESLHEFSKDLAMEAELSFEEDKEEENKLLLSAKPLTPTRPGELLNNSEFSKNIRDNSVNSDSDTPDPDISEPEMVVFPEVIDPVDSEMAEPGVPDPITVESDSDPDIAENVEEKNVEPVGHDSKHLQQKREISKQDGKKVKKNSVTEWDLSDIFKKPKTQSAFKFEKKNENGKKIVIEMYFNSANTENQ